MLGHWARLEPYTPWFSLGRYVLVGAGATMYWVSLVFGRPGFVTRESASEKAKGLPARIAGSALGLMWLLLVGVVVWATPFPLAMAREYGAADPVKVWTPDADDFAMWMAWSADSRKLLVFDGSERVWVVDMQSGENDIAAEEASISRQPWLSAEEFTYRVRDAGKGAVWRYNIESGDRATVPLQGAPSYCLGESLAVYADDEGLWTAAVDGSDARLLFEGTVAQPTWSPDARHISFMRAKAYRETKGWGGLSVVDREGRDVRIPTGAMWHEFAWAKDGGLVVCEERRPAEGSIEDWLFLQGLVLRHFDTNGIASWSDEFRTCMWLSPFCVVSVNQASGAVSFAAGSTWLPGMGASVRVYTRDSTTGQLERMPARFMEVSSLEWSPDGTMLAVAGTLGELRLNLRTRTSEFPMEPGIWVVSAPRGAGGGR